MRIAAVAVAVGTVVGLGWSLVSPRRSRHARDSQLQWWPALAVGLMLQFLGGSLEGGPAIALLLVSYGLLLVFAAANLHTAGMGLVGLGIALNMAAIAVNAGMPVRADAMVSAGVVAAGDVGSIDLSGKHHLEDADDRLMIISDVLPVAALDEVVSMGDVVMALGLAVVLAHLLHRRRGGGSSATIGP